MQNNGKNVLSNLPDRMMHRNFKYQGCTQQSVHCKWLDSLRARFWGWFYPVTVSRFQSVFLPAVPQSGLPCHEHAGQAVERIYP